MSLDIGQAIEEGGRRTVARNGLILVVVAFVLGVLNSLFFNTIIKRLLQMLPDPQGAGPNPMSFAQAFGPSIGLPTTVAGVLWVIAVLLTTVLSAAAIRTFVTSDTKTLPSERFTHNLFWMLLNLIIGGVVFAFVVGIGFILLGVLVALLQMVLGGGIIVGIVIALGVLVAGVLGIYLLVSLFFWNVFVILEDENFIQGFQNSWELTQGNRIMLLILGILVLIISAVVGVIFSIPGGMLPSVVGLAVTQIGSALTTVFGAATIARVYVQLN